MAIRDFIQKEARIARGFGIRAALQLGFYEVTTPFRNRLIWDDEWDICVVLDATRWDAFQQVALEYDWLDGVTSAWSVGSASPEWYGKTFAPDVDVEMGRVGIVTANPFSAKPSERAAGAPPGSLPLTDRGVGYLDEVWRNAWYDDPVSTVPPDVVTDRAISAWRDRRKHGVNRLVVHYMQPHIPFITRPEWFGKRGDLSYFGEPEMEEGTDPWHKVRQGRLPVDEFWIAYLDNLRWGLEAVDVLRRSVDARLLITSDHGNGMGEFGIWSHPPNQPHPILRRIPWVHVRAHDNKKYEPAAGGRETKTQSIKEKLRALGYV